MMDNRIKAVDRERDAALRQELFQGVLEARLTVPQAVKLMQKMSHLTQPEFAAHRGVSVQALRQVISGKGNPTVETLNKIAEIFGLEVGFVRKRKL